MGPPDRGKRRRRDPKHDPSPSVSRGEGLNEKYTPPAYYAKSCLVFAIYAVQFPLKFITNFVKYVLELVKHSLMLMNQFLYTALIELIQDCDGRSKWTEPGLLDKVQCPIIDPTISIQNAHYGISPFWS